MTDSLKMFSLQLANIPWAVTLRPSDLNLFEPGFPDLSSGGDDSGTSVRVLVRIKRVSDMKLRAGPLQLLSSH